MEKITNLQIISTGSYLHVNIIDKFEKIYKKRLLSCYGLTELGGPPTLQNWENTYLEGSVGYHSKEIKIKITKKSSNNQILIKSPYLMSFYINEKGKKLNPSLLMDILILEMLEVIKKELFIFGRRKRYCEKRC